MTALSIAALSAGCGGRQTGFTAPHLEVPFEHYSLQNGLDVILRKDDRVPVAAVNLWYHVGPANEEENNTGFAHLFEHMMLQGSGHAPGDFFRRLQAAGATSVNGNTDLDRTAFLEDVPSNRLELALWLESDRMGFLLDALDETTLANQKAVVRNERRQNVENAPYGLGHEELYRRLFPRGHPYRSSVLGSHAGIQSATLEDVRKFHRRFYVPNNASLAIVGDIDLKTTRALVQKYFGTIPRGPDVPQVDLEPVRLRREERTTVTDQVELPRVVMGWHTPAAFRPGDAAGTVTGRLLGGGKASRLFENLVYERRIAQSVSSRQRSLAQGSVFEIVATAKPGHTSGELEQAVESELERLARQGPGESELLATKSALVAITIKSLEPPGGVADRLNAYNHFLGKPDFLNQDLKRYADVSADDVKAFVRDSLLTDTGAVVHIEPGTKNLPPEPAAPPEPPASKPGRAAKPAAAKEAWRSQVPMPRTLPVTRVPIAKSFRLENGLSVHVARSGSLPLVTARLVTLQGTSSDPPELPGVADFSAAMLNEGAGGRSAIQIADDLTALGSTLDTGSSKEASWVDVQALKPQLRKTLSLMRDVVLSPVFSEREIERLRNDRLTALRQQRDDAMATAYRVMWRESYGPAHPYAHSDLGTEESIRRTSRRDLLDAYRRIFSPDNAALILTGDITERQARKLATEMFGNWKGSSVRPPAPPAGTPGPERVLIVDKPESPQSAIVLAQPGPARSDSDFPKLHLINRALGDLFSSRLNQNLRETHGYTYDVGSAVTQNRGPGLLRISTSVDQQHTGPSVREALKEVGGISEGGITQDELDEARQAALLSLAALYDTNASFASTIADLYTFGLAPDHFARVPDRLAAMNRTDLAEVARRYLQPGRMKVIVVGDRQVIEPQIASLDLGEIGYRSIDDLLP